MHKKTKTKADNLGKKCPAVLCTQLLYVSMITNHEQAFTRLARKGDRGMGLACDYRIRLYTGIVHSCNWGWTLKAPVQEKYMGFSNYIGYNYSLRISLKRDVVAQYDVRRPTCGTSDIAPNSTCVHTGLTATKHENIIK